MSGTQRKGGRTTQLARTTSKVSAALEARSRDLTSEEERVVRTRHGATVDGTARLERKASGAVLDELLLIEMELFRRRRDAAPSANDRKARIVRALRKTS